MMTKLASKVLVAALFGAFMFASAAPADAQSKNDKDQKERVKTYDFSGDDIDGDLVKPDGDLIDTRKFATHTSLINIRKDFIREILKSAEDL